MLVLCKRKHKNVPSIRLWFTHQKKDIDNKNYPVAKMVKINEIEELKNLEVKRYFSQKIPCFDTVITDLF